MLNLAAKLLSDWKPHALEPSSIHFRCRLREPGKGRKRAGGTGVSGCSGQGRGGEGRLREQGLPWMYPDGIRHPWETYTRMFNPHGCHLYG